MEKARPGKDTRIVSPLWAYAAEPSFISTPFMSTRFTITTSSSDRSTILKFNFIFHKVILLVKEKCSNIKYYEGIFYLILLPWHATIILKFDFKTSRRETAAPWDKPL